MNSLLDRLHLRYSGDIQVWKLDRQICVYKNQEGFEAGSRYFIVPGITP